MNFTHIKGDTFEEVNFQINFNSSPFNLTGCVLKMQLRKEYQGLVFLSLTSVANAGITIVNASAGTFKINKQIINIEAFDYLYDIELTKSNGDKKTWISGNFLVTNNVTE